MNSRKTAEYKQNSSKKQHKEAANHTADSISVKQSEYRKKLKIAIEDMNEY